MARRTSAIRCGTPAGENFVTGSHVVGQRTQPFLVEQLDAIEHIAIRFRPGGLYAFVHLPIG